MHFFEISSDNFYHRKKSKTKLCTICYPIGNQSSIKEKDLLNFIKLVYKGEVVENYRDNLEIDIYLPELKIGFEFNGLYWHSEEFKDKNYHVDKTNFFKENGIRIIHIWEDDWDNKCDIIKSQILNWLNLIPEKIFARKCKPEKISDVKLARFFIDENHIQGFCQSSVKIGLFYENELVSIMTFDRFEGRKKMSEGEWNLNRFCTKKNINVIGGFSKLLSFFIKEYKVSRIVSYADKSWSIGNIYKSNGFIFKYSTSVDYSYIIRSVRHHKSKYRKKKNETISESTKMISEGIYKIYDCGKMKFEMIL